jgi:hypothetical protein
MANHRNLLETNMDSRDVFVNYVIAQFIASGLFGARLSPGAARGYGAES